MTNDKKVQKKKKRSFRLMNKGTGRWLCLIFFVSAWMFILGIFAGRGTAPVQFDIEKLQKELIVLKEAIIKKELSRFKIDSNATDSKTNLEFYEALKDTKEHTKEHKFIHSDVSGQKRKFPIKKTEPEKAVSTKAPKKKKTLALDKKNETGKNFTIQVASLKKLEAADKIVKKLIKKGYRAYTTSANIPKKGVWHRVRIGDFKTKAEAGSALNKLKKEKLNGFVVGKIQ